MYRRPETEADRRLRAARLACGERKRLNRTRGKVWADLGAAEAALATAAAQLRAEERDVERYQAGVWAFLYDLVADREGRLDQERREAMAARARHDERTRERDRLAEALAALDARLAQLAGADDELAAARDHKRAEILAQGGALAEQLEAATEESARVDAELQAVGEALAAGERARARLATLAELLDKARSWATADLLDDDSLITQMMKEERLEQARGAAGAAQADLALFGAELAEAGRVLDAAVDATSSHSPFLDRWFDSIFTDWAILSRLEEAQQTTARARALVDEHLAHLAARRDALVAREAELATIDRALLAPPVSPRADAGD